VRRLTSGVIRNLRQFSQDRNRGDAMRPAKDNPLCCSARVWRWHFSDVTHAGKANSAAENQRSIEYERPAPRCDDDRRKYL